MEKYPNFQEQEAELRRRLGQTLKENVSLSDVTPFGLGGPADWYFVADQAEKIILAERAARATHIPILILGSGSQTVVSDFGFSGLVIHNQCQKIEYVTETAQILVESGVPLSQLVLGAANHSLGGMEYYHRFPGTVGGLLANRYCLASNLPLPYIRTLTAIDQLGELRQIEIGELKLACQPPYPIFLAAILQLTHTSRAEILRRMAAVERGRRRFKGGTDWLGPVFSPPDNNQSDQLVKLFKKAKCLGLRVGDVCFSARVPNYLEGLPALRRSARDVRALVTQVYDRLSAVVSEPPLVKLRFVGTWESETGG